MAKDGLRSSSLLDIDVIAVIWPFYKETNCQAHGYAMHTALCNTRDGCNIGQPVAVESCIHHGSVAGLAVGHHCSVCGSPWE